MDLDIKRIVTPMQYGQFLTEEMDETKGKKIVARHEIEVESEVYFMFFTSFERRRRLLAEERIGAVDFDPGGVFDGERENGFGTGVMRFHHHAHNDALAGGEPHACLSGHVQNGNRKNTTMLSTIGKFLAAELNMGPFFVQKGLGLFGRCFAVCLGISNWPGRFLRQLQRTGLG